MRPDSGFLRMLVLTAGTCSSQVIQSQSIEIKLPPAVSSETVFIRYVLAGETFGGWVQPRSDVSSYVIGIAPGGRPAAGIKAVVYAPGCAIETLDVSLASSDIESYSFGCRPLGSVRIAGRVARPERLYGHNVRLQARYIARWAHTFLGLNDDTVLAIPVGDPASLSEDGSFRMTVPDLARDALAGAADHAGELQLWVKDQTSGDWIAQLIAAGPEAVKARMGGLKIQSQYPAETAFTLCAVNSIPLRDREGFARRTDLGSCDR